MITCCCADPECMANGCRRTRGQQETRSPNINWPVVDRLFGPIDYDKKAKQLYEFSRLDLEKTLRALYPRMFDSKLSHYPNDEIRELMIRVATTWEHLSDPEKELYRLRAKELS